MLYVPSLNWGLESRNSSGYITPLSLLKRLYNSLNTKCPFLNSLDSRFVHTNGFAVVRVELPDLRRCLSSPDSTVYAVDAKLNFDDNASFRQQSIYAMRDKSMEDARDVAAEEIGLNYIGLSGNIGCLGNQPGFAQSPLRMQWRLGTVYSVLWVT